MSEDPKLYGFVAGGEESPKKSYPMEFISNHLIGSNPDDENGYWDTREQAMQFFATEFINIAQRAKNQFLFVRTPPQLQESFEGGWRMVGRFSIAKLKE